MGAQWAAELPVPCVCACMRACVCTCVRVIMRACGRAGGSVLMSIAVCVLGVRQSYSLQWHRKVCPPAYREKWRTIQQWHERACTVTAIPPAFAPCNM